MHVKEWGASLTVYLCGGIVYTESFIDADILPKKLSGVFGVVQTTSRQVDRHTNIYQSKPSMSKKGYWGAQFLPVLNQPNRLAWR